MNPRHFGSALIGALLVALVPVSETLAQSVVFPGNRAVKVGLVSERFAIGQSVVNPKTLKVASLDEMIRLAAGQPRAKMFLKYGGNFERYWQASKSSFGGKAFEAMLADSMNRHFAELGSNQRIAITAIEGAAHHPADLVLLGEDGRVLAQIQSKLGWSKAIEALDDPKYAAMSIVTARDSLAIIEKELLKAEASAACRGIQLPEQWQTVRKALASGRLMREPLPGLMLPTKAGALAGAEHTALAEWNRLGATARGAEVADASIGLGTKISTKSLLLGTDEAEIAGAAIRLGGIVGGALIVLDVGATGFLAYQDFQRFNEAEIATGDYAFKGSLRATNLYLLYITVADPEPITKAGAAVALVVLIAVDVGHDWVIDSGNAAARQLLKSIDREERKQAVRGYLLDCVRQSGARPEPRLPEAAQ